MIFDMAGFDYKLYWNERLKGDFGLESVGYIGLGRNFNLWMYRLRRVVFVKNVRRLNMKFATARILDVGCGNGFYISLWRKLRAKGIHGIDISKQSILNLKAKFPDCKFDEMDITAVDFSSGKYDVISCMDVLFHVVDDERFETAMSNLSKSLNRGGYLIITDNFLKGGTIRATHHISRSWGCYESVLNSCSLKVVKRSPCFYFLNYPVDSKNTLLHAIWRFLLKYIPGHEHLGYLAGLFFYPFDRALVFLLNDGPSTEILICEKQ